MRGAQAACLNVTIPAPYTPAPLPASLHPCPPPCLSSSSIPRLRPPSPAPRRSSCWTWAATTSARTEPRRWPVSVTVLGFRCRPVRGLVQVAAAHSAAHTQALACGQHSGVRAVESSRRDAEKGSHCSAAPVLIPCLPPHTALQLRSRATRACARWSCLTTPLLLMAPRPLPTSSSTTCRCEEGAGFFVGLRLWG